MTDIAEIGDLLRLAAAIDEEAAAELVQEFDLDRVATSCARDRNLGRHVALLHGLHAASRSACLSVAQKVYEEKSESQSLQGLLEECESSEQALQLVRSLRIVAPHLAIQVMKGIIELGRERFIALLGVEANLQLASTWVRTAYSFQSIVPVDLQDEIVTLMRDMLYYDDRLSSCVEAALSLIDINRQPESSPYVENILKASHQVAGLRSPMQLIEFLLRLMRIDQSLNQSCVEASLGHIAPELLERLLNAEEATPVVAGFVNYLLRHHAGSAAARYGRILDNHSMRLLSRLEHSTVTPSSLIARMLLGEAPEVVIDITRRLQSDDLILYHPWELGLIETVFALAYQRDDRVLFVDSNPLKDLAPAQCEATIARRRRYFGEDVSGIKCALSLRSTFDLKCMGLSSGSIDKIITQRTASDHRNAVRRLLNRSLLLSEFARYPYYLKVLFDETVFVRYRFEWSAKIMNEVHSRMFATKLN